MIVHDWMAALPAGLENSEDEQTIDAAPNLKRTFSQFGALDAIASAAEI